MTDEQAKELGRRALAAGFAWAPRCRGRVRGFWFTYLRGVPGYEFNCPPDCQHGRCGTPGVRHHIASEDGRFDGYLYGAEFDRDAWPDLRDAATLGVLRAQVAAAWDVHLRAASRREPPALIAHGRWEACRRVGWVVTVDGGSVGVLGEGAAEVEAWVAALEAAPARDADHG